jgi:hypothetical protein
MVYIAIPSYNGLLHWTTVAGIAQTARLCGEKKIGFAVDVIPGDAFVGKARNLLVHRFLKSGFRDLVFVDADVGFSAEGIIKLCEAEPPLVMGLYRMKCPPPTRFPALLYDPVIRHPSNPDLVKLQYGPAGFMRVRREVFEAMQEKWPDEYYVNAGEESLFDYFPCGRVGNHFTGEDLNFCIRAEQCGFDVWAHQGIELKHTGEHCWESNWAIDQLQLVEKEAA